MVSGTCAAQGGRHVGLLVAVCYRRFVRPAQLIVLSLLVSLSALVGGCGSGSAEPQQTTPADTAAHGDTADPEDPAAGSETAPADLASDDAQDAASDTFCDGTDDCGALGALTSESSGGDFGMGGLGRGTAEGSASAAAPLPPANVRHVVVRGLDEQVVRRVLRRHLNEVRFCYEQALRQQPGVEGSVQVEFAIDARGLVSQSRATGGTAESARLSDCLVRAVRRWTFPSPPGNGDAQVAATYQFALAPAAATSPQVAIGPALLQRCAPDEVTPRPTSPATLQLDPPVGGCWLTNGFGAPPSPRPATEVLAVADEAALGALMSCPPGGRAQAAPNTSYFTLADVHRSADTWEVAFAVDDGQRVHAGLRLRRACQGVAPREVLATTLMALAGGGRALTVHRCEPDPTPCPPVP